MNNKCADQTAGCTDWSAPLLFICIKIRFPCVAVQNISTAYHAVLTLMAVSLIAKISFPFGCFVFDINELKVKFVDHYAITKADSE